MAMPAAEQKKSRSEGLTPLGGPERSDLLGKMGPYPLPSKRKTSRARAFWGPSGAENYHIGPPERAAGGFFYTTSVGLPKLNLSHTTSASLPEAQLIAYYLREPPRP